MKPENGQFDNPIANFEAYRRAKSYQTGEATPPPSDFYDQDAPETASSGEHTGVYTRLSGWKPPKDVFVPNRIVGRSSSERPTAADLSDNERRHLERKVAYDDSRIEYVSPRSVLRRAKDKVSKVVDHVALLGDHAMGLHKEEAHPVCVQCTDPGWDTRAWDSVVFK